jgi:uncharacterized protein (TIGR04255 family)
MPRKDLKNKPLVEAILELKWVLPPAPGLPAGFQGDPNYRLLLGRFSERVQSTHPFHEPLPTAQIPDGMVAQMVQHRFRTSENGWPLIQLGPGIMTVNETERYVWDDFLERCTKAVAILFEAYPAKEKFAVQDLTLRYIDAVDVDHKRDNVFKFLQEKMRTSISLPDQLFDGERVNKNPTVFNWQASFPQQDPGGHITLRFAIGQRNGKPALIWETLVQAARDHMPAIPAGFSDWLTKAHELTDDWFFKLIEGELERRFSGE